MASYACPKDCSVPCSKRNIPAMLMATKYAGLSRIRDLTCRTDPFPRPPAQDVP